MKTALRIFLAVFLLVNFFFAWAGIYSILLTVSVYFIATYVCALLIRFFISNISLRKNATLAIIVFFSGLFATEVFLKYGMKKHLSYEEADGGFFFSSPYPRTNVGNLVMGKLLGKSIFERVVNEPNDVDGINRIEYQYPHRYNALGLRGKLPEKLQSSDRLLLGLGDSYTEGMGTPEDSTWIALLADLLNAESDSGITYRAINGGIIGSDPVAQYKVLEKLLETYRFQHVLLAINETDIYDIITGGGMERYDSKGNIIARPPPWFDFFYGFSFISRIILHDVFHYNYFLMSNAEYAQEERKAITTLYECIEKYYLPAANKHGFTLWIILHPSLEELQHCFLRLSPLEKRLRPLPAVHTLNLHDAFQQRKEKEELRFEDLYWQMDGHHNSAGYALWARCIGDAMNQQQ